MSIPNNQKSIHRDGPETALIMKDAIMRQSSNTSNTIQAMRKPLVPCFFSGAIGASTATATGMEIDNSVGCTVLASIFAF